MQKTKKLERLVFYLIILLLPTQLGLHLWPEFASVSGIRVDYLSPTIYVTDLLIFILFSLVFYKKNFWLKFWKAKKWIFTWMLCVVGGILISKNPYAGVYGLIKIFEFTFLGIYISQALQEANVLKKTTILLSIGVIYESLIAFGQFFSKSSLGQGLYYLGERSFTGQTPGIANASINGELVLRPYATFSHPNVLAAFLLIALIFVFFTFKNAKSIKEKAFLLFAIAIGSVALVLAMSRVAIIAYACLFLALIIYFKKKEILAILALVIVVFFVSPASGRLLNLSMSDLSVTDRAKLTNTSCQMIKKSPILGVGLNNFFYNAPDYYEGHGVQYLQPVHNVFLLIASQTGIIGMYFFTWFLLKILARIKKTKDKAIKLFKIALLLTFIILGLFDHYFLTIQQGQLLLVLIIGYVFTSNNHLTKKTTI